MTRKHFTALAAQIRHMPVEHSVKVTVADHVADTCAMFNDNFDRDKFMEAATS